MNERIVRIRNRALAVGAVFLLATFAGAWLDSAQFFRSYLMGYLLWLGIAIGSIGAVSLGHLGGGQWPLVSRRILEAATRTVPLTALLFVPVVAGVHSLYPWSHPDIVAKDAVLQMKAAYLNVPFFIGRAVFYFLCWFLLAHFLNKWSRERDATGDPALSRKLRAISAGGLILYVLTATFASVDWLVSLDPHWYSSIYGLLFVSGQGLATFSFTVIVLTLVASYPPLNEIVTRKHFHDLGNLMLAFVMLWAYMAFSQLLIIWSGNLQVEITYYVNRVWGGWAGVALALLLFHFALPFLILLSRQVKRNWRRLSNIALWVLGMRIVDYYWVVEPPFETRGPRLSWMDFTAPIGIGGVWLAYYFWQLLRAPLLEENAPEYAAFVGHEEEAGGV